MTTNKKKEMKKDLFTEWILPYLRKVVRDKEKELKELKNVLSKVTQNQ